MIKSWSAANTLYYYQDKLGSTTHVANASGQLVESYHYDLTGTPTETSTHGVVDLYAGERWIPGLGLYDLRNRFMSPELGRFLQTDPIGLQGDASNLHRYCGNDPVNRSDPTGLYKIGSGLSPEEKKQLEAAQKEAAEKLEKGANAIEYGIAAGKDSGPFKAVQRDFEGVFHKPITVEDMKKYEKDARNMVTALRDDGRKGFVIVGKDQAYLAKWAPSHANDVAFAVHRGGQIFVNTTLAFKSEAELGFSLSWMIGHESAHNIGIPDDVYRNNPQYKTLTSQQALRNADSYIDFAFRQ